MGATRRGGAGAHGLVVRDERADDEAAVDELVSAAFDHRPNEVALVRGLRRGRPPALSRVAVVGEEVVGHAMLSPLGLGDADVGLLGLAPVAVAPSWQGRGVGRRLTEDALAVADARGAPAVVVLGEPSYYGRFGFVPAADRKMAPPTGVDVRAFMVRPLSSYRPSLRGTVRYPPLFADTGTL